MSEILFKSTQSLEQTALLLLQLSLKGFNRCVGMRNIYNEYGSVQETVYIGFDVETDENISNNSKFTKRVSTYRGNWECPWTAKDFLVTYDIVVDISFSITKDYNSPYIIDMSKDGELTQLYSSIPMDNFMDGNYDTRLYENGSMLYENWNLVVNKGEFILTKVEKQ